LITVPLRLFRKTCWALDPRVRDPDVGMLFVAEEHELGDASIGLVEQVLAVVAVLDAVGGVGR
jgi:hypothetical protein